MRQIGPGARRAAIVGCGTALLGVAALAAFAAPPAYKVSQYGRAFQPGQLAIKRGETVRFVNDDVDLLHHAYVESDAFNFDAGEIAPGAQADITFPRSGAFTVLCGIHPKMKLSVRVD